MDSLLVQSQGQTESQQHLQSSQPLLSQMQSQPQQSQSRPQASQQQAQPMSEIDEKLKGFNIHQLRLLAKHKSISTSINKDPMIEKIKSVYRFRNAREIVETLNLLNSPNHRPYPYAYLDMESSPIMMEVRKMNDKIDTILQRICTIERRQNEIRTTLRRLCGNPVGHSTGNDGYES